jgi:hypothetical protein
MPTFEDPKDAAAFDRLITKAAVEDTYTPDGINVRRYWHEIQAKKAALGLDAVIVGAPVEEAPAEEPPAVVLCDCGEKPLEECQQECLKAVEETPAEPEAPVTEVTPEAPAEEPAEKKAELRLHVVAHEKGWTYREEEGEPQGEFRTQALAEKAAKEAAAAAGGGEVVIHGKDGKIRDSDTIEGGNESDAEDTVR